MKYLIFGRGGWLAQKFNDFLEDSYISPIDVTDLAAVRRELDEKKPEVVINTAGKTGRPNIDWCEEHDTETIVSNIIGARKIQIACAERGIFWVHLSSGCIFQGQGFNGKGFKEHDAAFPPSWYSYTKHWTDEFLKNKPVLIVRLRLPIDNVPHPRNLIDKLRKYEKVWDPENSVTVIPDFLEAVKELIKRRRTGIYHIVNPGTISPARIMEIYQQIVDPNHQFQLIKEEDFYKQGLAKAIRSNCFLNTEKLQREGIKLKPIQERIIEVMKEYKQRINQGIPTKAQTKSLKLLVTGGAGFIGSNFIHYWLERYPNDKIVNLDVLTYAGNLANLIGIENNPNYKFIKGDICDLENNKKILRQEKIDVIINFAAESHNGRAVIEPDIFVKTNILGTQMLLEAAKEAGIERFHHISCYDEKTRAFTKEGLKSFKEIKKGDFVLTLNIEKKEVEWKPVEEVIIQEYNDKMIRIKTRRVDFLVTPNHRMLIQKKKSKKLVYKEAKQIKNEAINKLPIYYKWTGKIKNILKSRKDLKNFMYILGIFIGDGHLSYQEKKMINKTGLAKAEYIEKSRDKSGRFSSIGKIGDKTFTISKSWRIFLDIPEKDPCRKRCEESLDRLGINWHPHKGKDFTRIYFGSKKFFKIFQECGRYAKNKEIPRWALDMPTDLLNNLWEGLLDSDGYKRDTFYTSSLKLAYQFMELCVKLNLNPVLNTRYSINKIGNREIKGFSYYITCRKKQWRDIRKKSITEEEYNGKIWCLKIKDNRNFLIERNGKTAFCGNTCEVFGDLALDENRAFKENEPYMPKTPYNASKAGANHKVMAYYHTFGLPVTISHCSNNYGFYQFPEKVIPRFITNAIDNKELPLFKSSQNKREWIHVRDHCKAIDSIIRKGRVGEAYNIGSGLEKDIEEIAEAVLKRLNKPLSLKTYIEDRPGHDRRYLLDATKIKQELGWEPEIDFEKGMDEVVDWYVKNENWWRPLIGKGFVENYKKVKI